MEHFSPLLCLYPLHQMRLPLLLNVTFLQLVLCLMFIVADGGGQWGLNTF